MVVSACLCIFAVRHNTVQYVSYLYLIAMYDSFMYVLIKYHVNVRVMDHYVVRRRMNNARL
jgi:hypothetical protein